MKGTEFLVDAMVQEGIDHIFLVPGGLIDAFYPTLCATKGISAIVAAHEGGAAYMADGYARASGRFGVCFAIGGPGATNTVTALATAVTDQSPLLLVTGEVATNVEGLGGFQDASPDGIDDISILKTVTRLSLSVENPRVLRQHLHQAMAVMLGLTRGPVHLSVPTDVQHAEIEHHYHPTSEFLQKFDFASDSAVDAVWELLNGAAVKVAILAGAGTEAGAGPPLLRAFAEKFQIPVATTLRAKGVLPEDHPLSLGVFGYAGTRHAIEALLSNSLDVLIVLGSGLNQRDTLFWNRGLRSCKKMVQVDKNPAQIGAAYAVDLPIVGHCETVLRRLVDGPAARSAAFDATRSKRAQWLETIRKLPRLYDVENCASDAMPIHPARLIHDLRQVMPRDTTLVVDSGAHRAFAGHYWQAYEPRQYISATNLGPMGWAIPAAIGVKLARPESPCVVITGDGCMQMHGIELATAARFGVAVIYVVINNRALGNVYLRAKQMGEGPAEMTEIPDHDWVAFGKALGVAGWRVEAPADLVPTFERALALGKPCVIDVRCGRDYTTPVTPFAEAQKTWHEQEHWNMAQLNMSLDKMPPKSRAVYEQLKANRGSLEGMYLTLLNHPDLTEHVAQLGTYLRFGATLPGDVREVMILLTAHFLNAGYEWIKHEPAALDAGVPQSTIDAIRAGKPLAPISADYGLLEQMRNCIAEHRSLPQDLQDAVIYRWGTSGALELVVLVGFYGMIAGILTSFDVPLPTIKGGG